MSPAAAAARVYASVGVYQPVVVHRPPSPVVHVGSWTRHHRPLCGQRGKRFAGPLKVELVAHKRLCARCKALVEARTAPLDLAPADVMLELLRARTVADVLELRPAVITAGPTTRVDGRALHAHYAEALIRVRKDQR